MKNSAFTVLKLIVFLISSTLTIIFYHKSFQFPESQHTLLFEAIFTSIIVFISCGSVIEIWYKQIIINFQSNSNKVFIDKANRVSDFISDGSHYFGSTIFFFITIVFSSMILDSWLLGIISIIAGCLTSIGLYHKTQFFKSYLASQL